uniref:Uncharacterized protein n=1 Tax=Romanomermis culicivorax TaxID=13658 RepID=A0A915IY78_ROMCU
MLLHYDWLAIPASVLDVSNNNASCCCSEIGLGTNSVVGFATTATQIRNTGQHKPINDTKNDWRRQHNRVVSTDGSIAIPDGNCPPVPEDWCSLRSPPFGGMVIDLPGEDMVSLTTTTKNEAA